MKKYKSFILLFLFVMNSLISYSLRIDDISFNQRMDTSDGGYRETYIINNSLSKKRYKINLLKGNTNDGSKFVQIYPKIITVNPKSKGVVKVFAKAPINAKQGEYDFKLQFQPISIPTLAKGTDGRIEGTSNVSVAPIIGMKGYVGEIDFSQALRFEEIEVLKNKDKKGIIVKGKLSNDAFAGIDFGAEAYGTNNFLYGSTYVADLPKNIKNKEIILSFPMIEHPEELKKILFYRTPSKVREVIKEIIISN